VDRCIPGDAVAVGLEHDRRLVGERGILDPRLGQRFRDPPVELRVGWVVDDRAAVVPLQVDGVDRAARGELGEELVRPLGGRVELEATRARA
jgi:hypothetical protein